MVDFTLLGQLPRHHYVYIDSTFTHHEPIGFIPATWYGLVGLRARTWGCTVMLESGAVYRNLPPHAIAFSKNPAPAWTVNDAQRWDCYGERFTVLEYAYLSGLECLAHCNEGEASKNLLGDYLFTVGPIADGFSAYPEQAKEFSFIRLSNDRLTIQPTNHVLFRERSFTTNDAMQVPKGLRRQLEVYTCEGLPRPFVQSQPPTAKTEEFARCPRCVGVGRTKGTSIDDVTCGLCNGRGVVGT